MAFGKIFEVALASVEEALAPDAARPDRDLRLGDVIAGAERIAFGIEEHVDPLALIAVHHAVDDRRGDARSPPPAPAKIHHGKPARNMTVTPHSSDHDAGAKVGLDEDQDGGNAEQRQRRPDRAPFADLGGGHELVETGEREDDRRLHEFRRLEA